MPATKFKAPKPLLSVVLATASAAGTHGTNGKLRDRRKNRRAKAWRKDHLNG